MLIIMNFTKIPLLNCQFFTISSVFFQKFLTFSAFLKCFSTIRAWILNFQPGIQTILMEYFFAVSALNDFASLDFTKANLA